MDMQGIKGLAYELLANKYGHISREKGEKYYHGERVALLAVKFRKYLYPDDSGYDNILTAAAWLHDILNGTPDHCVEGAKMAREVLSPYCARTELDEILLM